MATITTLNANDNGSVSRTTINNNFTALNPTGSVVGTTDTQTLTNKTLTTPRVETSILDSAGNEILEWTEAGSAVNQINIGNSNSGSDLVIKATGTNANINVRLNGKGTGTIKLGTANIRWPNSDGSANYYLKTDGSATTSFAQPAFTELSGTLGLAQGGTGISVASGLNCMMRPAFPESTSATGATFSSNTAARVGLVIIPCWITINQVSITSGGTVTSAGDFDIGLFSNDGQTRHFTTTFAVATTDTVYTATLGAAVTLAPGCYYIMGVSNGTANFTVNTYTTLAGQKIDSSGENVFEGTLTVTADTIPTTFTPTSISSAVNNALICRLDN